MAFEDLLNEYMSQRSKEREQASGGVVGAGLGTLSSLFLGNQQANAYGDQLSTLRSQMDSMPTLESMYGQNSPYALQLKQTLARRDAKAGRNSQYGPREAQFQAALADKASTYSAQQAQAMQAYNTARTQAQQAQAQVRAQQLASLFNFANKSGITDWATKGLSGLFGNKQAADLFNPDYSLGGGQNYTSWNTAPSDPTNQFSLGTGGMSGYKPDESALMPNWEDDTTANWAPTDAGTGSAGGDPYQWY